MAIYNGDNGDNTFTDPDGNDTFNGGEGIDRIQSKGDGNFVLTDTSLGKSVNHSLTKSSGPLNLHISDFDNLISTLTVNQDATVTDANVNFTIYHQWDSDLEIYLNHDGKSVMLVDEEGESDENFLDTTLDDEANISITDTAAPFTGAFIPDSPLTSFDGGTTKGGWQLEIRDTGLGNDGHLAFWSLDVSYMQNQNNVLNSIEKATLSGGVSSNKLDATTFTKGSVFLKGGDGDDTLLGSLGNDKLKGGGGQDLMAGGKGNDVYFVSTIGETLTEAANAGRDTVKSSIQYILPTNLENLTLTGNKPCSGYGNDLNNKIIGNAETNNLEGYAGNDGIQGNNGNDKLDGGTGNDTLVGGEGQDIFRFSDTDGFDSIKDFVVADDTVELASAAFTSLPSQGVITEANFKVGTAAVDANDYVIYYPVTGELFYDEDGNGDQPALQIGLLGDNLALTYADFVMY